MKIIIIKIKMINIIIIIKFCIMMNIKLNLIIMKIMNILKVNMIDMKIEINPATLRNTHPITHATTQSTTHPNKYWMIFNPKDATRTKELDQLIEILDDQQD